ncbi:MAG: ATP-dependent DNA helicase RecG [Fibrobacter sp.]|nr:ATP-dependent DNA helicase RecG [Fibrobacter sp.]
MDRSACAKLDFLSPVSSIPGMGPKRVDALAESGIETMGDFLYYFPYRYIDRSEIIPLNKIGDYVGRECTVKGKVGSIRTAFRPRQRLSMVLNDGMRAIELIWFYGVQYIGREFSGAEVVVSGKVGKYNDRFQMVHPIIDKISESEDAVPIKIVPRYSVTKAMREAGIQQKILIKSMQWSLKNLKHFPRVLPDAIESKKNFPPLKQCLSEIHFPSESLDSLNRFKERISYERLYSFVLSIRLSKRKFSLPGRSLNAGNLPERFRKMLPFELTEDQIGAIGELFKDAGSKTRMHRLLHGEAGSGKTLTAFFACLPALNEGYQAAWLAPTEVLARQTYKVISGWLKPLGFETGLLTGGFAVSKKQAILNSLKTGEINFIVGTHALLQSSVVFKKLGMVVIDEQHKFGVQQRLALQEKDLAADFLLMSATPIPQTLASTYYGDLDVSTIRKCPTGRQKVSTHLVPDFKRADMEKFIEEHLSCGERVFYVVPRIESVSDENSEPVNPSMKDVETVFKELKTGIFSKWSIQYIHGKMKSEQKEKIMVDFANGEIDILVTTTIIEVGIDVPEATIMVIENADYFGLSQLHQLRGRVGRGSKKSYCFLLTANKSNTYAQKRLSDFSKTHDGFKIAEMDLKFRGPGEMAGVKQSGWSDLLVAEILENPELYKEIQTEIDQISLQ